MTLHSIPRMRRKSSGVVIEVFVALGPCTVCGPARSYSRTKIVSSSVPRGVTAHQLDGALFVRTKNNHTSSSHGETSGEIHGDFSPLKPRAYAPDFEGDDVDSDVIHQLLAPHTHHATY